jgi:membrane-associated phospholipid phosphatase
MLNHLDTEILLTLNGLLRAYFWLPKLVSGLAVNPLARGIPVFVPLVVLWFSPNHSTHRGRMTLGLGATCFATLASVLLQKYLHVNIRPAFDPSLHLYQAINLDLSVWNRRSSFPGDTTTLYFALSTMIFLEWRWGGVLAYIWSFITTGICRVALGFHYPSDIAAGIILGVGTVYLLTSIPRLTNWAQYHLEQNETRTPWIHAVLFLLLADAYSQFQGLQGLMHLLIRINRWG